MDPAGSYITSIGGSGLSNLRAVTADAAGNIYVSQLQSNTVSKIPAGGGTPVVIGSGFNQPAGLVVDAQGNVFVTDAGNNAVKKIPAGGGPISTVATGFQFPYAIAIDAAHNLYVTNINNGLVQKIPAAGGLPVTIGPAFNGPDGIAVDALGNIYITERNTNLIKKIPAGSNTPVTLGSANGNPNGIVVDATGNLYYADLNNTDIKKIPAGGGAAVSVGSGLSTPVGLGIDDKGIIYVSDFNNQAIKIFTPSGGYVISPALPPGLSFNAVTGAITGTPTLPTAPVDYKVTAFNATSFTSAIVNITIASDAGLVKLKLNSGTLVPGFSGGVTAYTVKVPFTIASLKVTPTASFSRDTIMVNGVVVASDSTSASLPLAVGDNVITTKVKARYGTAAKTYTVTVTRDGSLSTALLTVLKLNPAATLTTVSGPGYKNYTTTVPGTQASVMVLPTAQNSNATIKVNGIAVVSGASSAAIPLNIGSNVINVVVTSVDGTSTKSYIITVIKVPSSIATLSNYNLSAGVLSPAFTPTATSYTTIVPNVTSSIKVTPTATDVNAVIKVNGVVVTSGAASASLPLVAGPNTITTVVTAQDGTTTKTYSTTVTRAAANLSTKALLTSLKINPATTLTTVTGPGYKNYTTTVPNTETSLTVIPTAQDVNATIQVNGTLTKSGVASQPISLNVGDNVINVVITAQDGATTLSYIITATRTPSAIATLSELTLSAGTLTPLFASATVNYASAVPNSISSITIIPTTTNAGAAVKVNGVSVTSGSASQAIALSVGNNIITTVVTAQDGTTNQTYTTTVTRAVPPSTNALLTIFKLSPATTLTAATGTGYKNYTTAIPNSETSLKVLPTAQDATATIKVNGVAVLSGAESQAIALNVGSNTITTVVTAQDGVTTKSYIVTATRAAASLATQYVEEKPVDLRYAEPVLVHPGLSPNGDGDNDVLTIDGITRYPDNNLQIMNRSGALIYEVKGYDNTTKVFDGHSSSTGKLQLAGTYFYSLSYKDDGETKHKTGFIILKY